MSHTPADEQAVFEAVRKLDSRELREACLQRMCSGDDTLKMRVAALLRAHEENQSFLEFPPLGLGSDSLPPDEDIAIDRHLTERPGTTIGPYKLLEQIGEGGMGVVFMAEQERPVRRRVALKIIKPGMDTRQVIARFEAERQALAMMDHPNIAKVLDAGTTSVAGSLREPSPAEPPSSIVHPASSIQQGRPYFVMELVQGVPITEYCDQCNLTTRERLELFITVCQAVQHAHQKGIIHRDIKPTNVLVQGTGTFFAQGTQGTGSFFAEAEQTPHSTAGAKPSTKSAKKVPVPLSPAVPFLPERPLVKIIDFGVAKAIGDQSLTERTLTTAFAQMIGTPMYMSPEQAELSPLGVDTRSDIYSLGVLLYELLTGATPFDQARLREVSYDELRRIIREEEPPRPSARLSSLSLLERAGVRASRSGEPSRTSFDSLPLAGRAGEAETAAAMDSAAFVTTIAEKRRTDPRRLVQTIRGELDWIVMKCLEKDRNRRYETPNSLARDVERYMRDEPVQACPPSMGYRFRKFARRNNRLLAAGGAIVVSLVIGLGLSAWMYLRAATERARAQAASDVLQEIFAPYNPDQVSGSQDSIRELTDNFSAGLGDQLAGEPEVEAAIRSVVGKSRWRMGVYGRAEPAAETEFAVSYAWLANYLAANHREEEAKAVIRKLADHLDKAAKRGLAPAFHVNALFYLAIVRLRLGDEAGYREACAAMLHVPIDDADDSVPYQRAWIWCLGPHAGDDLSVPLEQAEELVASNSLDPVDAHWIHIGVLGGVLYRAGQYEQAAQRLNESIAAQQSDPLRAFRTALDRQLLLSMTKWQMGQRDEARRQLAELQPALNQWLRSPSNFWLRRAQVEVLRREAEALINPGKDTAAMEKGASLPQESKP